MKGQYNIPGRLAGWEDMSLARVLASAVDTTGTVTACEVTIVQKVQEDIPALPVGTLVLDVASNLFKPQPLNLGPIRPGGFAVYISKLTGGGTVGFSVYLEGFVQDGSYAP